MPARVLNGGVNPKATPELEHFASTPLQFHQRKSFDHISLLQMFFDDLGDVFGPDLGVHCAVGVDHDGGAAGASGRWSRIRSRSK